MGTWQETIGQAEEKLRAAQHILNGPYGLTRETKLLINSFMEIDKALRLIVVGLMKREQIMMSMNPKVNFTLFKQRVLPKIADADPGTAEKIMKILEIGRKHRDAAFEFTKNEKFVIFLGDSYEILTESVLRDFIGTVKMFLKD